MQIGHFDATHYPAQKPAHFIPERFLKTPPPAPDFTEADRSIAIVASLYNRELTDALTDSAHSELQAIAPNATFPVFRVPGAFEIPVTIENLCRKGQFSAIIALGVIVRGETAHADLIAASITRTLQEISVRHAIPVIHEVLLVDTIEQAAERVSGEEMNRGVEAARAAAGMADLFSQIESAYAAIDEEVEESQTESS
ncbi:MAG: 6,7-dimethyl-8-ribityllumazine synthase [Verrucomicrobiales bacterium]